jgi:hypothetical protein
MGVFSVVIEHQFVTILDADQTFQVANDLLVQRGFTLAQEQEITGSTFGARRVEMRRGRATAKEATSEAEFPQRLRLEWDRGRVTALIAVDVSGRVLSGNRRRGGFTGVVFSGDITGADNKPGLHRDMAFGIVRALEMMLVQEVTPEEACEEWTRIEQQIAMRAQEIRRRRRRSRITLSIIAAVFILAVVILIIVAASSK